jgi:hypothetical protein
MATTHHDFIEVHCLFKKIMDFIDQNMDSNVHRSRSNGLNLLIKIIAQLGLSLKLIPKLGG